MEGEAEMKELFKKDIFIKIASVLFAILLWLTVLNKNNPFITSTPIRVRVEFINESSLTEKGLVLMNKDRLRNYVEIFVRGRQEDISRINQDDFTVVADFSKVKSENDTALEIEKPDFDLKDVYISDITPRHISIEIEKVIKKTFPVQLVSNITLKEGYRIINERITPETIDIENVQSKVEAVDSVKVLVDIKNLDKNTVMKKECLVYNKDGNEILSLSKKDSVEVEIEVAREVPIIPVIKGKPAADYVVVGTKISTEKALITGSPEKLAKANELKLETLDIQNINNDVNVLKPIILPDGITLIDTPTEVEVNVIVEQLIKKEFTISKEEITLLNAETGQPLIFEIKTDNIKVSVKGKQADFSSLNKNVFNPTIDVAGLDEGTHKLPVKIFLPAAFSQVGEAHVEIKISKIEEPKE